MGVVERILTHGQAVHPRGNYKRYGKWPPEQSQAMAWSLVPMGLPRLHGLPAFKPQRLLSF
jgi:hypothetical protein